MTTFTDKQLADLEAFCKVQSSGKYNIVDLKARNATKLTSSRYLFVLSNYDGLKKQHKQRKEAYSAALTAYQMEDEMMEARRPSNE